MEASCGVLRTPTIGRKHAAGTIWGDIKRLLNHRAIYPAVLILFMFQFSPGSNTPLQFYLSDHLHASDEVYGAFNAIFAASFLPMFFVYGWLCKRVPLRTLLWWGTIITAPQLVPLLFINSPESSLILAAPIGADGRHRRPAPISILPSAPVRAACRAR